MAEWVDIEKARALPGLRLVLTGGVPGPWGEAAKGVFHVKGIPFARVRQDAAQANEALVEWTGHANAPATCLRPGSGVGSLFPGGFLHRAGQNLPEPRRIGVGQVVANICLFICFLSFLHQLAHLLIYT